MFNGLMGELDAICDEIKQNELKVVHITFFYVLHSCTMHFEPHLAGNHMKLG